MNKIRKLFEEIPDEELKETIKEIADSDTNGYIKENGLVRKYAKLSGEITGGLTTTDFYMTITNLLKQAAFRYINL